MNRDKVVSGLMMLADRTNDDTCEGLKCCEIAEDAIVLLTYQEKQIEDLRDIIAILQGGEIDVRHKKSN